MLLLLLLLLWRRRRRERRGKVQRRRLGVLHLHLRLRERRPGALHRLHGCGELHEGRLLIRLMGLLTLLLGREPGGGAEWRHGRRVLLVHGHGGRRGGRRRQVGLVKSCGGGGGEERRGSCRVREAAGCQGRRGTRRVMRLLLLLRGVLIVMVMVVGVNHVPGVRVEGRLLRHSVGAGHPHGR